MYFFSVLHHLLPFSVNKDAYKIELLTIFANRTSLNCILHVNEVIGHERQYRESDRSPKQKATKSSSNFVEIQQTLGQRHCYLCNSPQVTNSRLTSWKFVATKAQAPLLRFVVQLVVRPIKCGIAVSYTHLTLPTKRIV